MEGGTERGWRFGLVLLTNEFLATEKIKTSEQSCPRALEMNASLFPNSSFELL